MSEQGYLNVIFNDNYSVANTPLPYLAVIIFCAVTSLKPNIFILRINNILISFFTTLLFIFLFNLFTNKLDLRILIFIFYPYYLKVSFLYLIAIYGTLFLLLSIIIINKSFRYSPFLSGLSTSFGILSQQFLLTFPFAYIIYNSLLKLKKEVSGLSFKSVLFFCLPLVVPLILFFFWGGITHNNFRAHAISFQPSHLTAILSIIGITFIPFIITNFKNILTKSSLIIALLSIVLGVFFIPNWQVRGGSSQITGYTFHLFDLVNRYIPLFYNLVIPLAVFLGLQTLFIIYKKINLNLELLLLISCLTFIAGFTFNELLAERHLLPLITLLYLLILPKMPKGFLLVVWTSTQVIFGLLYLFYSLYVPSSTVL